MKLIFILFLITTNLFCSMNMEGFYEGQYGRSYESDVFDWNIWEPNLYLETRLYGEPVNHSNFYIKFYTDKDYNISNRPLSVLAEGHIGFSGDSDGNGFRTTFFTRESHHYWLDGSMLGLINTDAVNNSGNGQGVRFDFWHSYNGSMSYTFSDFSQDGGDDIHLFRYRQSFVDNKINTGLFFQRKHYPDGNINDYNQVIGYDIKVRAGKYYFTTELATSKVPSDSLTTDLTNSYSKQDFLKSNFAIISELRGFRFGTPKTGYWFLNPGFFSYGNTYRNYMGNDDHNKYGYWINSYYLVPERAITYVLNYTRYQNIVGETIPVFSDSLQLKNIYNPGTILYSEVYVEFINGFKGKISFNKKNEERQGQQYKHYDFFSEVSVENKLAKLLGQFKIKDIGEVWEKHIVGLELSVNLTNQWKFFTRGMIANDRAGSRYSMLTEFKYSMAENSELYIQYGPNYWGQYGLVHDDGFASSGEMRKELRLIIKGWF